MTYRIHEFYDVNSHLDLPGSLVGGIEECVSSAFGGGITQEDARHHMAGGQVLVAQNDTHIGGFTTTSITSPSEEFKDPSLSDERGAYFAAAAIRQETQGAGLYRTLNANRLAFALAGGVALVFTRTQNPRVEEGISNSLNELVQIGEIEGHELERTLFKGVYGTMLTATKPEGRTVKYDIDYEQGDALLLSWKIKR